MNAIVIALTLLVAAPQTAAHPCRLAPEYRQFDYWLGEWDVEIGGEKRARQHPARAR